jgi:hypothetical protein
LKVTALFDNGSPAWGDFSAKKPGRDSSAKFFETDFAKLCGKHNWLLTSGEVEILKILTKALPLAAT